MLVVLHILRMLTWPWPDPRSRSRSRGFWTSDNQRGHACWRRWPQPPCGAFWFAYIYSYNWIIVWLLINVNYSKIIKHDFNVWFRQQLSGMQVLAVVHSSLLFTQVWLCYRLLALSDVIFLSFSLGDTEVVSVLICAGLDTVHDNCMCCKCPSHLGICL